MIEIGCTPRMQRQTRFYFVEQLVDPVTIVSADDQAMIAKHDHVCPRRISHHSLNGSSQR
jgi:hypothetical protein